MISYPESKTCPESNSAPYNPLVPPFTFQSYFTGSHPQLSVNPDTEGKVKVLTWKLQKLMGRRRETAEKKGMVMAPQKPISWQQHSATARQLCTMVSSKVKAKKNCGDFQKP
ncbi:hypothetical protein OUZ56_009822 [Daphnia magna]|uniref:Uncharacterized protein n=1 Tax=Daphnia magna TaxID=35525 RepID=A0ABR0AH87_9CRUS|nr:hypothetical protein OUZ56_009822 [Daphnia magna]